VFGNKGHTNTIRIEYGYLCLREIYSRFIKVQGPVWLNELGSWII